MGSDTAQERLREAFRLERPVPRTPAGRRLRWLIGLTALAVVVVEGITVFSVDTPGFGLVVRTSWAAARVVGFLVLMRAVRFGRVGSRPLGLILAVTTVFAVARLAQPRAGSLVPGPAVLAGVVLLAGLCGALVWQLYRSPAVHEHLSGRQERRHIPGWVLTARVCVLAYSALLFVPLFVALPIAFHPEGGRRSQSATVFILGAWFGLGVAVALVVPFVSLFVVFGQRWARRTIGAVTVVVLVLQPLLCFLVLGLDGLLRDGVPLVVTAVLALVALYRSRGQPTWVRPNAGTGPVAPSGRGSR